MRYRDHPALARAILPNVLPTYGIPVTAADISAGTVPDTLVLPRWFAELGQVPRDKLPALVLERHAVFAANALISSRHPFDAELGVRCKHREQELTAVLGPFGDPIDKAAAAHVVQGFAQDFTAWFVRNRTAMVGFYEFALIQMKGA
jgi:hypothetical protein